MTTDTVSAVVSVGCAQDTKADPAKGAAAGDDSYEHLLPILIDYHDRDVADPGRRRLRDQLVAELLPLAHNLARRYHSRGVPEDDLQQVAALGLLHAINRFDPGRGLPFLGFAVPTIRGELRRYFRDRTWAVRAPRALMDLGVEVRSARETLTTRTGRSPRPSDIARFLDVDVEHVRQAITAAEAYNTSSLDRPVKDDAGGAATIGDLLGADDCDLEQVTNHEALHQALSQLPERERTIILLRFFGNKTQSQIAEQVGCSQMHVSRLLATTLTHLRHLLDGSDPDPARIRPT